MTVKDSALILAGWIAACLGSGYLVSFAAQALQR